MSRRMPFRIALGAADIRAQKANGDQDKTRRESISSAY